MHSLVMSACSRDLIVTLLVVQLIGTVFLDSELSTCFLMLLILLYSHMKCLSVECNTCYASYYILGG